LKAVLRKTSLPNVGSLDGSAAGWLVGDAAAVEVLVVEALVFEALADAVLFVEAALDVPEPDPEPQPAVAAATITARQPSAVRSSDLK
jgi:hypothetical protein